MADTANSDALIKRTEEIILRPSINSPHHPRKFLKEIMAVLRPRIVKFARLADNDRASADDEDGLDVSAFGHYGANPKKAAIKANKPKAAAPITASAAFVPIHSSVLFAR